MQENKWIVSDSEEDNLKLLENTSDKERLELLGNLIVDRILEEEANRKMDSQ